MRAQPDEMAVDALQLGEQDADHHRAVGHLEAEQLLDRQAKHEAVGLRAQVVHALDERDDLLPLLLLGGLLDAGVQVPDRGRAETTTSPSISRTRRNTPWVEGCCGPMLTVIVSRRIGIDVLRLPRPARRPRE